MDLLISNQRQADSQFGTKIKHLGDEGWNLCANSLSHQPASTDTPPREPFLATISEIQSAPGKADLSSQTISDEDCTICTAIQNLGSRLRTAPLYNIDIYLVRALIGSRYSSILNVYESWNSRDGLFSIGPVGCVLLGAPASFT
ncbi:hypothetical protein AB1N83_004506 [Pleurotus pulmonarius]